MTLPAVETPAVARSSSASRTDPEAPQQPSGQGLRVLAVPRPRRPVRLLFPDPRQDRPASWSAIRSDMSSGTHRRSSTTSPARSGGEPISYQQEVRRAKRPTLRCSSATSSSSCRRTSSPASTTWSKNASEPIWDLLQARGGGGGAGGDQRVAISGKPPEQRIRRRADGLPAPHAPARWLIVASIFGVDLGFPGEAGRRRVLGNG